MNFDYTNMYYLPENYKITEGFEMRLLISQIVKNAISKNGTVKNVRIVSGRNKKDCIKNYQGFYGAECDLVIDSVPQDSVIVPTDILVAI